MAKSYVRKLERELLPIRLGKPTMTPDPDADYATGAGIAPPGGDDDNGRDRIEEEPASSEHGLRPDHGDTGTAITSSDIAADLAALEGLRPRGPPVAGLFLVRGGR